MVSSRENKKKKIKKNYRYNVMVDIENGVVKRKIKIEEKLKKNIKYNVMERWNMVWSREK